MFRTHSFVQLPPSMTRPRSSTPLLPELLLGMGLGGLLDGIVLHQILQWHHLLSSEADDAVTTLTGLKRNTRADGLFHLSTWLAAITGIGMLTSQGVARHRRRDVAGWMLVGWGLFNILEGILSHHVLGLHHVREGGDSWDVAFLALGVVLVAAGTILVRDRSLAPEQG